MTTFISAAGIVVAAAVATAGYLFTQRLSRNERLAQLFADSLRPVGEYRGCPFAIRRRQADDAVTRAKFADWLSQMHTSMDYYVNLITLEAPGVGPAYRNLVDVLRNEVDPYAKDAWLHEPVSSDAGMNMELGKQYPAPRTSDAVERCLTAMAAELRRLKWR